MNPTSNPLNALEGCIGLFRGNRITQSGLQGQNITFPQFASRVDHNGTPTPNEMDRIIAKEMTGLSIEERENAENDVHGIGRNGREDPLSLQTALLHINRHLQTLKQGTVYEEAEEMNPDYVCDPTFRLMFLRADRYDPKEAAERMIRFFDLKKTLFGFDKLVKDITLADLSADDMATMHSGYMQVSPYRDMAGRTIVVGMLKLRQLKKGENASRVAFYIFMSAVESEQAQILGLVSVYYLLDANNFQSVTGKLRTAMPVHFNSLHLCYNDITQYAVTCMGVYGLNQRTKVRFRPHFGSHIEVQYALTTFGIPRQALPVSPSGEMYTNQHEIWLAERTVIDEEREQLFPLSKNISPSPLLNGIQSDVISGSVSASASVTLPFPQISWSSSKSSSDTPEGNLLTIRTHDVLFGRGRTVVEHPGNLRFRNIVGIKMAEYEVASRMEKTCMTESIVQIVKQADGRFLKRGDEGGWEEVDDETARRKVAHAFRNRRKK